jgi:hypothetical protein
MADSSLKKSVSLVPNSRSGATVAVNPYRSNGSFGEQRDPLRKSGTIAEESRKFSVLVDPNRFKFAES